MNKAFDVMIRAIHVSTYKKNFGKSDISYPLIRTRTCAY